MSAGGVAAKQSACASVGLRMGIGVAVEVGDRVVRIFRMWVCRII